MRRIFFLIHKWLSIPFGIFISIMCFTGAILIFKSEIAALFSCDPNDMAFFKAVTRLHRWLFISPENPHGGFSFGRLLMGVSAIATTLILISGVVLWWPKNTAVLKKHLSVSFTHGWRRFVHDSHVSLGIYAFIFVLLMSLTGPVWSFQWYRKAAVAVIGGKEEGRNPHAPAGKGESASPAFQHEGKEVQRPERSGRGDGDEVKREEHRGGRPAPEGDNLKHSPHGGGERNAAVAHGEKELAVAHGEREAAVAHGAKEMRQGDANANPKVERKGGNSPQKTFIYLHTGKWGGLLTQIIYFLAAIIGGFLPISGYYMWLKKK